MLTGYKCDICKRSLLGDDYVHRFRTNQNKLIRICGHCVREYGGKKEVEEAYSLGNVILIK